MNIVKEIKELLAELSSSKNISLKKAELREGPAGASDLNYIEGRKTVSATFLEFYKEMNGLEVSWTVNHTAQLSGRIKILPFSSVIVNWKGIVYFDDTPEDDPLRRFFPIDFFADEACSGIYATPDQKANIYYYPFEGEPFDLHLDIFGYCQMMIEARGFSYWQLALKALISGEDNYNSLQFREHMPVLFPEFSFQQFQEKYKSLKIK